MFDKLIQTLKNAPKTIVFTEGNDPRILEASAKILQDDFLKPILVGSEEEILGVAKKNGFNVEGATIIDPANYDKMDEMIDTLCELRKKKGLTREDAARMLSQANYFGTMLVKMGYADALLGGATYSTADTVRPALQIIKTKPGNSIVSSCFILSREKDGNNELLAMGDCAINIDPTEDQLVEIAEETIKCAKIFGMDPKTAFLSYSSLGSGKGEDVDKVRNACAKAKEKMPEEAIDGELQFDAAVSPEVARTKCPDSPVAGYANTFIFPDINAGNIGYKIAQRLGGFDAYGPVLLGLNAPINDLSRGCNAEEVYSMAIITAALA
ncbi:MAG: phosphate acetyltransferase [Lachnoclostridium sp.]|nr:phosphate acetyltransferase [Lachnoclostridium sp.]MDD7520909.1 phosphate acetyltransferase [Lachnoclostridium sp.]